MSTPLHKLATPDDRTTCPVEGCRRSYRGDTPSRPGWHRVVMVSCDGRRTMTVYVCPAHAADYRAGGGRA